MKNHSVGIVTILLFILFSCDTNAKKSAATADKEKEVVHDAIPKETTSHESATTKTTDLSSKLETKVSRLASLEHNYQLKKLDTVIAEKSVLLGSMHRVKSLRDSLTQHIDFNLFESELHQIQKAFLKGTKPMRTNGDTYPRVLVEEYIFNTSKAANAVYDMLMKSKTGSRLWMYISKAPHEVFLEENRVYFMRSGGFYMMEIYKDIFEKLKG